MPVDRNNAERKQKPRNEHAPYKPRKPKTGANKNGPKSSAQPQKKQRSNLTLYDWMMVFAYIDEHPDTSQDKIVKHTRKMFSFLINLHFPANLKKANSGGPS